MLGCVGLLIQEILGFVIGSENVWSRVSLVLLYLVHYMCYCCSRSSEQEDWLFLGELDEWFQLGEVVLQ